MIAYKLVRRMKNGELKSLFIDKTKTLELNTWYDAESHPTKGFKERVGWHCALVPHAPHLTTKGRVWIMVDIKGTTFYERPESQGGTWVLGKKMKILKILE